MLKNIFKPAWQSSSVEKRLKAISEMDGANGDSQEILTSLTADEEAAVCIAAIRKLTSATVLHEISLKHSDKSVRAEAEKRVDKLLGTDGFLSKEQCLELVKSYPELKLRVALVASSSAARAEVIQSLPVDLLFEVLAKATFTDTRQFIAEMLTKIDELESAREILRGKDKKAERILQIKIDQFKEQERQRIKNTAIVEKLIKQVEDLAGSDWRPEIKYKLQHNRSQWESLDFEIDSDTSQCYEAAVKIIGARFEEQINIEKTQQSQEQLIEETKAFLEDVAGLDVERAIATVSNIEIELDRLSLEWQCFKDQAEPKPALEQKFKRMVDALRSVTQLLLQVDEIIQAGEPGSDDSDVSEQSGDKNRSDQQMQKFGVALKKLKWPSSYGELKLATELKTRLADWKKSQKAAEIERQQKLGDLHKTITSIFRLSRSGKLIRAKQLCERVEKKLDYYEGKDRASLEERLEEARKTLDDMGDWKNFATEPKYIDLCEAMEKLGGSKKHPDNLMAEMKELQNIWKSLGHSDISDQYWPRFKQAADRVYQPCAEFFESRSEIRKANLEKRQQYVERMQKLFEDTDWENEFDHNAIRSLMRSISDKFFNIKDVEHRVGQKQWKQFTRIKKEIVEKLDATYEENAALKNELIQRAKALAETDAKEENLAKLKTLQFNWKQIGPAKRAQDEKAWTAFKEQCDIVYNKVQEVRYGQRKETNEKLTAYKDIIKGIQTLARQADNLIEADQGFSELQSKYSELPELPKQLPEKLIEGIERDYRNACKSFDECHARLVSAVRNQRLDALRQKADLCSQLEALQESPSAENRQEVLRRWDSIELNDEALSQRIEARRNAVGSNVDRVEIGEKRRMLCIQLEITKGIESPEEDKVLRMQYQLEQMNKSGLGSQVIDSAEQIENMELDWLCMPGAQPELQKELDERFKRVLRS